MKHISILVPVGETVLSSVIGPFKIFNQANKMMMENEKLKNPVFNVQLIGLKKKSDLYDGAFSIQPHVTIDKVDKTDLIIIPAIFGDLEKETQDNADYVPWIRKQYKNGAEVASLCMGAFILASTGLLNGKACTTHWMGADAFKAIFPDVQLLPEKIITEQNGIYTSGGAYSFLNLVLYLVEKFCGREVALFCTKMFEIDIERSSQSQFAIFSGQKEHGDAAIVQVQQFIEQNHNEKITIEELANKSNISRRNFIRRFKKATGNTPIEYIQRVKIEAAKKSLESTTENVTEVMFGVGYTDSKSFRNLFRKLTGLTPKEYRNKYNRILRVA